MFIYLFTSTFSTPLIKCFSLLLCTLLPPLLESRIQPLHRKTCIRYYRLFCLMFLNFAHAVPRVICQINWNQATFVLDLNLKYLVGQL